jgi:hypothetical protein
MTNARGLYRETQRMQLTPCGAGKRNSPKYGITARRPIRHRIAQENVSVTLPPLNDWDITRDHLHRAAQVLGVVRKAFTPPQPNALHLSLRVVPEGLSTGPLNIGSFTLNFGAARVEYVSHPGAKPTYISLLHQTPKLLPMQILQEIAAAYPDQTLRILPKASDDPTPFALDSGLSAEYAAAQYTVFTALARFRARLSGGMTPLVVWPHHFDLSMLWFAPGAPPDEHQTPHLNFGFSPFSEGFDRPYLYAYCWPIPPGLTQRPLPAPARWHAASWTGVVIDYDALRDTLHEDAPPAFQIEALAEAIFEVLRAPQPPA